ncbi:MAG: glycosyltransferase [Lachnospiraceae bacterium]|nr:glycosyltransferase [Lachnospiraceae bacterium]
MKIGTAVFTYNRSKHTEQVLNELSKNTILPEKLFLFQDGLKNENDKVEWEKVKEIIRGVNWCETEVIEANQNKGLANSIVDGVNYVFEDYEAIIVLEDDCVPHPQFMEYMVQSLNQYAKNLEVYCINAYGWPVEAKENGTDAYFCGRAGSWGWGTWKECWAEYEREYTLIGKIKKDRKANERFHIWGQDLESYVLGNVKGNCNSWATFFALKIIEKDGLCLTPYNSFVYNIGLDGTGVHCGALPYEQRSRSKDELLPIKLPSKVELVADYQKTYEGWFSWTPIEKKLECYNGVMEQWIKMLVQGYSIESYLLKKQINKIAVWGRGKLFNLLYEQLSCVKIEAIIESYMTDKCYKDIPIISSYEITDDIQLIIIIPIYDINQIRNKVQNYKNIQVLGIDELISNVNKEAELY